MGFLSESPFAVFVKKALNYVTIIRLHQFTFQRRENELFTRGIMVFIPTQLLAPVKR